MKLMLMYPRCALHCTVSPAAHYQNVLKEQRPATPLSCTEGSLHHRHLSDNMNRCTSAYTSSSPTPFNRGSPKTDSPYEPYPTQQVSSSRIAFAKSQTFTLAEVHKFRENASTLLDQEESINKRSSESPRVSTDYLSEIVMDNDMKEESTQSKSNQAWHGTTAENCSLYNNYCEESNRREYELSEEPLPVTGCIGHKSQPAVLSPLSASYRCNTCSERSESNDYNCSDCSECNEDSDCCYKQDYYYDEGRIECERSVSYEYDGADTEDHSPTYDSMTPEQQSPPKREENEYSDLAQLKHNLATRLCFNITACSCQIWLIQNEFMSLVTNNIAVITRALIRNEYEDLRNKMKSLNAVIEVPLDKVDGHVVMITAHDL